MSLIQSILSRNLRSYLSTVRIVGALSSKRVRRSTPAFSNDTIESVDAVNPRFAPVTEGNKNSKRGDVAQNLLASDVVDSLLHIQNEISALDEAPPTITNASTQAIRAYQNALDHMTAMEEEAVTFHLGN